MTLSKLIRLAQGYQDLGHAVQSQLGNVLDGDTADLNPNALDLIAAWVRRVGQALQDDPAMQEDLVCFYEHLDAAYAAADRR